MIDGLGNYEAIFTDNAVKNTMDIVKNIELCGTIHLV